MEISQKIPQKLLSPQIYTLQQFINFKGSVNTPLIVKKSPTNPTEYVIANVNVADTQKI